MFPKLNIVAWVSLDAILAVILGSGVNRLFDVLQIKNCLIGILFRDHLGEMAAIFNSDETRLSTCELVIVGKQMTTF